MKVDKPPYNKRCGSVRNGNGPVRDELSDSELALEARSGNRAAFQSLVQRHTKRVYWTAYNVVHKHEDAEDVAQEAFIRVYRFLDKYNPKQRFTTWLYQIVVNLSIDSLRKKKRKQATALDKVPEVAGDQDGPFQETERKEKQERVREVLEGLPQQYKIILVLRDIEGLPSQEVSEVLKVNHATVRWRLHRARGLFKEMWEARYGKET